MPDGFVIVDRDGQVRQVNHTFLDLVQAGVEGAVVGQNIKRWLSRPGTGIRVIMNLVEQHGTVRAMRTTLEGELGASTEVEVSAVGDQVNRPLHFGLVIRDVASRGGERGEVSPLSALIDEFPEGTLENVVRSSVEFDRAQAYHQCAGQRGRQSNHGGEGPWHQPPGFVRQAQKIQAAGSLDGPVERPLREVRPLAHAQPMSPAFGTANLSNCEREQIHLAGSIQPHGALLVIGEPDHVIVQASDNAAAYLGVGHNLQGLRVRALGGSLWERTTKSRPESAESIPTAVRCTIGARNEPCNALIHRAPDGELIVEIEHAGPGTEVSQIGIRRFFRCRRHDPPDPLRRKREGLSTAHRLRSGYGVSI